MCNNYFFLSMFNINVILPTKKKKFLMHLTDINLPPLGPIARNVLTYRSRLYYVYCL